MNEYNQTRVDVGNDSLLKDCYMKVLIPLMAAIPKVKITQHTTNKRLLHISIPVNKNLIIPVNIPVEQMRTGAGFASDIALFRMRVRAFYKDDQTGPIASTMAGGFSEKELKETPLSVVNTAEDVMVSEIPVGLKAGYNDRLKVVKAKYGEDLKDIIHCCIVETDCKRVVDTSVRDVTRR